MLWLEVDSHFILFFKNKYNFPFHSSSGKLRTAKYELLAYAASPGECILLKAWMVQRKDGKRTNLGR